MEFPDAGKQCSNKECKQLDFLPVKCAYCLLIFCKDHSTPWEHKCPKVPDNVVAEKQVAESFRCTLEGCKTSDAVQMNCAVCKKHFCLEHRHHGCLDAEPSKSKKEKHQLPKEQFKKAKAETDKVIAGKLSASSNKSLVNKIKLMKLKRVAVGDNHIPTDDRIFFAVAPPLEGKEKSESKAVFVSKLWTVGRSVDLMARRLKIVNKGGEPSGPFLRLFNVDGEIISLKMDTVISSLVSDGVLVDGDSLILEYMSQEDLNNQSERFSTDTSILTKYQWM